MSIMNPWTQFLRKGISVTLSSLKTLTVNQTSGLRGKEERYGEEGGRCKKEMENKVITEGDDNNNMWQHHYLDKKVAAMEETCGKGASKSSPTTACMGPER